jgi:hypothetical protein
VVLPWSTCAMMAILRRLLLKTSGPFRRGNSGRESVSEISVYRIPCDRISPRRTPFYLAPSKIRVKKLGRHAACRTWVARPAARGAGHKIVAVATRLGAAETSSRSEDRKAKTEPSHTPGRLWIRRVFIAMVGRGRQVDRITMLAIAVTLVGVPR